MGKTSLRSESSSKSDKKFDKKVQFYTKVRETVASLGAHKAISKKKKLRTRQKKLKAYDLSDLTEFLPDPNAPTQRPVTPEQKVTSKTRQKLVVKEGDRLKTVLNHPCFKSHPLAIIHEHLKSTQPITPENIRKNLNGKRKKGKSKKSKASVGAKAMDI